MKKGECLRFMMTGDCRGIISIEDIESICEVFVGSKKDVVIRSKSGVDYHSSDLFETIMERVVRNIK